MTGQSPATDWKKSLLLLFTFLLIARIAVSFFMPITDPSEGRYSAMARNMDTTGNYLVPHYTHNGVYQSFDGKPPLFFQMAAVSCRIFDCNSFAPRFPSLLTAVLLVLLAYWTGRRLVSERAGYFAALFCTLNVIFYIFSGIALTDMVLTFTICGAIFAYMLFLDAKVRRERKFFSVLFFAMLGLGMITKGPVAVGLAGLPIFLFSLYAKRWRDLKDHAWVAGTLVFLAIALPWFVLMTKANPEFLHYFFVNENFMRFFASGDYGDKYGSGRDYFHGAALLWFLAVNAPFYLLLLAPKMRRNLLPTLAKPQPPVVGLAAWAFVSITLFWCLTKRIPVYYVLPTAPMLSFYLGVLADRSGYLDDGRGMRNALRAAWIWGGILAAGLVIAAFVVRDFTDKSTQIPLHMLDEYHNRCYFAEDTPYSAEFHAGHGRVVRHEGEEVTESLKKSANCFLLFRIDSLDRLRRKAPELIDAQDEIMGRKLLFRQGLWTVYTPVLIEKGEKK